MLVGWLVGSVWFCSLCFFFVFSSLKLFLNSVQIHQYATQLNVPATQESEVAKQEDTPGRSRESKTHYLCTTSLLPRHSDAQQTHVSFFPRRPKWYKR